MSVSLLPTLMVDAVTDLTPALLNTLNIRLLMLDFDNTIVPYTTDAPTEEMTAWLEAVKASETALCVVSNSRKPRVVEFCRVHQLSYVNNACKPFPKGIRECMRRYGLPPEQCALAGDQIYTDTLGANAAGIRSILVRAIHNHNIWLKLRHIAELPFIFAARKRRLKK